MARGELWSREVLLRQVFGRMVERLRAALHERDLSAVTLQAKPSVCAPLEQVPLQVSDLLIDPCRPWSACCAPPGSTCSGSPTPRRR
jgi:hypothetical protein